MPISWVPKREALLKQLYDFEKDSYDKDVWWNPPTGADEPYTPPDNLTPQEAPPTGADEPYWTTPQERFIREAEAKRKAAQGSMYSPLQQGPKTTLTPGESMEAATLPFRTVGAAVTAPFREGGVPQTAPNLDMALQSILAGKSAQAYIDWKDPRIYPWQDVLTDAYRIKRRAEGAEDTQVEQELDAGVKDLIIEEGAKTPILGQGIGVKDLAENAPDIQFALLNIGARAAPILARGAALAGKKAAQNARLAVKEFKANPEAGFARLPGKGQIPETGTIVPKEGTIPQPQTPLDVAKTKFITVMDDAQKAIKETEGLRYPERQQRVAEYMSTLRTGEGRQAFQEASGALKGKYSISDFPPITNKFTPEEYTSLQNAIRDAAVGNKIRPFQSKVASDALDNLFLEGTRPRQHELDIFRDVFGDEFVKSIQSMSGQDKILWNILDALNAPRSVLSSYDLSAALRQGGILTARRPVLGAKSVGVQVKALFSEKYANTIDDIIRTDPVFGLAQDAGLYITPKDAARLWQREEAFMSKLAQKIPGVKQSERAYVTGLNYLRLNSFKQAAKVLEKAGGVQADFEELAKLINYASGRGSYPRTIQGTAPLANAMFFSPRLIFSRLQLPTMLFSSSPMVRKEAAKMLVSFLGAGTSVVSMLKLAGAEVEIDPRSSDFGKAKFGNTRLDLWTGYAQYARFLAQLALAERKATTGGGITKLNRKEVVDRFLQSKLSPAAGLLNDILQGKTYSGEAMGLDTESVQQQTYNRLMPLFIQDMIDAIEADGAAGAGIALPGVLGVGVTSYKPKQPVGGLPPLKGIKNTLPAYKPLP